MKSPNFIYWFKVFFATINKYGSFIQFDLFEIEFRVTLSMSMLSCFKSSTNMAVPCGFEIEIRVSTVSNVILELRCLFLC